jgi:hypothetical protein
VSPFQSFETQHDDGERRKKVRDVLFGLDYKGSKNIMLKTRRNK